HSQYCYRFRRFHTHPKQGRRLARRRTESRNEGLCELSSPGAPPDPIFWIWAFMYNSLTAGRLRKEVKRRPDPSARHVADIGIFRLELCGFEYDHSSGNARFSSTAS